MRWRFTRSMFHELTQINMEKIKQRQDTCLAKTSLVQITQRKKISLFILHDTFLDRMRHLVTSVRDENPSNRKTRGVYHFYATRIVPFSELLYFQVVADTRTSSQMLHTWFYGYHAGKNLKKFKLCCKT